MSTRFLVPAEHYHKVARQRREQRLALRDRPLADRDMLSEIELLRREADAHVKAFQAEAHARRVQDETIATLRKRNRQ